MYNTFINGVQHVWLGISIFLLLILSFSRTTIFKNALTERHFDRRRLVLFTVLFSAMAVSGTYWSVSAGGGIINFRAVGIMLAGFIGGPASVLLPALLPVCTAPFSLIQMHHISMAGFPFFKA